MIHDVCADPLEPRWRAKVDKAVRAVFREAGLTGASQPKFRDRRPRRTTPISKRPVSAREKEALVCFKAGMLNGQVAVALGVSKQRASQLRARLQAKGLLT